MTFDRSFSLSKLELYCFMALQICSIPSAQHSIFQCFSSPPAEQWHAEHYRSEETGSKSQPPGRRRHFCRLITQKLFIALYPPLSSAAASTDLSENAAKKLMHYGNSHHFSAWVCAALGSGS